MFAPNLKLFKMKKLFLFLATAALAVSMNSCSSDDNSDSNSGGTPGGTITTKINGVSKTFDNVLVNVRDFSNDGGYVFLDVTATIGTNTNELITFSTIQGELGATAIDDFSYKSGSNRFFNNGEFSSVAQINSNNRVKGNFSGKLTYYDGNENITATFTDGSFDFTY